MRRLSNLSPSRRVLRMLSLSKFMRFTVPLVSLSMALAQTREDRIAAALRDQHFDTALGLVREALKESPANAQLWTMQGVALEGQGKNREALSSFRRALKISPDYIPALEQTAQLEFDAGDPDGIPVLEHLLRLRPDDLTSHGMLAVLAYQKGDCEAATAHFEKAAALFESKLPALHAYGVCLVRLKRFDKADDVFQKSMALNPGDARERQ